MIEDRFEYLFVIVSDRIGMVRKDAADFTVVTVSEDGDPMTDFSSPDEYWDQWKKLTNFSDSSSKVDFAFLSDRKDVELVSAEGRKQDDFKRVDESEWSLSAVERALRSVAGELKLTEGMDVLEGDKKVLSTGLAVPKCIMYLKRFGKVHDDPAPVVVEIVETQPKDDPPPEPKHSQPIKKLPADCLGSDEKAQVLKVGDVIRGVVKTVSPLRNKCFVDSGDLSAQLRMRYADLTTYCDSVKRPLPAEGDKIGLRILSVDKSPRLVDLCVEVID